MRYRLWFKKSEEYLVRQGVFLSEITKPASHEDDLVTAILLTDGLKGRLSQQVVFGELKKWKSTDGEERIFIRIDNHKSGRYILTPFKLEEVLARGSTPIDQRTDFQRVELRGASIKDIFDTYDKELVSSDGRPFVLAQQDSML